MSPNWDVHPRREKCIERTIKYKHALMETNSMREVEKKTGISLSTLKQIKKQAKEEQLLSEK